MHRIGHFEKKNIRSVTLAIFRIVFRIADSQVLLGKFVKVF